MDVNSGPTPNRKKPKYAAALRYRSGVDKAPVVVASGQGEIATTILKMAKEAGVPDYVEPALAEVLAKMEPGSEIPESTYRLVASILAFIWRLDKQYHSLHGG
jgi:flagellar biosynthesis protein